MRDDLINLAGQMRIEAGKTFNGFDHQVVERFALAFEEIDDLEEKVDVVGVGIVTPVNVHHVIFA